MKKCMAILMAALMTVLALSGCTATQVDENALVIGGIGPVTGVAAAYGQGVKNGATLAVEEINAAGGVNGLQLAFHFEDDEHDAEKAVNAYNTLKDKGIQLLMGTVTSVPCVAVAAKTAEDNMFQLTPSGSSVECIKNDNAFRICFSDPNQGAASAEYIAEHQLASKVAVIYNSSDVYSQGIYETFAAEAAARNLTITTAEAFTDDSATDFTVQLQKVKESGAELLFLPIYYEAAALILTQADNMDLDVKFFGCDGLDGIIGQLGDNAALADGVMLLTPFAADATDEKSVAFVTAYKEKYNNEIPNQFAADAYDAIYTIKAALEDAQVTDATISMSELCEKLKVSMQNITVAGVTGTMQWDASGEPTKDPKAMYIENGAYKAM
ncbi:MAG: amino acid ABC transporter substrate-binding protein [Ruminococcaceae bacterium]|nr:amino acid ABC transporter substrate-binding protein [Oscillospiraceae bacterium]